MTVRRVSIKDVAREAGVSVTTVSHALNHKGRLSEGTRSRVVEVAERLGYRANPAARHLVSGRAGLIAAMASLPDDPRVRFAEFGYYTALIGAASGAALARDSALVVAPPSRDGMIWDRVPLDGVLVIDPMVGDPVLAALRERNIPYVTIGRDPDGLQPACAVLADQDSGTWALLDHLHERGRRVGLLAVPPLNAFALDTVSCFERWCRSAGVPQTLEILDLETLLSRDEEALAGAIRRVLDAGAQAIYAPIELVGVQVARALRAMDVRVPEDVGVATTLDAGRAIDADPPLTTLSYDYPTMGRLAAEMLLDVIDRRRFGPITEVVPTFVEPRASTAWVHA
jgi:DNA-binding LacI/PurR family transcriptional regulator